MYADWCSYLSVPELQEQEYLSFPINSGYYHYFSQRAYGEVFESLNWSISKKLMSIDQIPSLSLCISMLLKSYFNFNISNVEVMALSERYIFIPLQELSRQQLHFDEDINYHTIGKPEINASPIYLPSVLLTWMQDLIPVRTLIGWHCPLTKTISREALKLAFSVPALYLGEITRVAELPCVQVAPSNADQVIFTRQLESQVKDHFLSDFVIPFAFCQVYGLVFSQGLYRIPELAKNCTRGCSSLNWVRDSLRKISRGMLPVILLPAPLFISSPQIYFALLRAFPLCSFSPEIRAVFDQVKVESNHMISFPLFERDNYQQLLQLLPTFWSLPDR